MKEQFEDFIDLDNSDNWNGIESGDYAPEENRYERLLHKKRRKSGRRTAAYKGGSKRHHRLTALDYVIYAAAALIVIAGAIVLAFFSEGRKTNEQLREFALLGDKMSDIGIAGEGTLLALAKPSAEIIEELPELVLPEYEEAEEEEKEIDVDLSLTSVMKDLKIKFINKKTGKLVGGIKFNVQVVDAGGNKKAYTDDDKDGIIYIKEITPGETKVILEAMEGTDNIKIPANTRIIKVKENIEYKKIDVSNEIKKESEINAAKEDTQQKLATEGVLADTVEWVESTKTPIGANTTYTPVNASDIQEPTVISGLDILNRIYYKYLDSIEGLLPQRVFATEPEEDTSSVEEEEEKAGDTEPTTSPTAEPTSEPSPTAEPTGEPSPTVEPTSEPSPTAEPTPSPVVSPTAGVSPTPSPTVIPTPTPKVNRGSGLVTKSGEQLYKKNGNNYTKATAGDYIDNKNQTFYKQVTSASGYKYTGWQNIDGSTYYFNAAGEKITGEQVIQGAKYNFDSNGVLQAGSGNLGIDVSKFNGNINWTQVRNSGVSYVIIRCGYRGSTVGALVEDPMFRTNIKGALAAGLKVGVYFFTQAVNEVEAVEEASMVLSQISGYKISYPVFLDVEGSGGRGDTIDSATRTRVIDAFCRTIASGGYSAGVYASKSWLEGRFNPGALGAYKIWLAQYNTKVTYSGRYNLWQYSSKGRISGINGNVDMNLSYLGY